ncbi:MAG: response regulator transcription factor [Solirubrobacterales bacterium]|nr:response regulator transcription factor [Solirubrobacterales bacterium]
MRILVVEDEAAIADFLERGLEAEGYSVTVASEGPDGLVEARSGNFDLLILDLMLPGMSGIEILKSFRKVDGTTPVILLTARTAVEDRVEGLDAGATDYIPKPFAFEELAARVRAHLRRPDQGEATTLTVGDIELNLLKRTVTRGGQEVNLSAREFDLLAYMMRHPGQVLSREQLLSGVWGYDYDPGTNVVGVYIQYLRRKLNVDDLPDPIETLRSVGYRLREE